MGNISTNVFIFFFSTLLLLLLIFILIIKNTSKYLKKAELEIQKLSGVIEQNPTSIVITDLSGNIQYVNSKFTENTGYTLKEIKGKNPSILKTGKSDTSLYENLWSTITSGQVWKGEFINRNKNGDEFIENTIIAPIFNQEGNKINYIAIKDEITERRRAERALRESEQKLTDIISLLPDATLVIDENGKITHWNLAMEEMTGLKAKDMIGKGNYEYALPFYGERRPILIDLALANGELRRNYLNVEEKGNIIRAESFVPNLKNGNHYAMGTASCLFDSFGKLVGAIEIIRDITEQKETEKKIVDQQQELEKLNELTRIINSTSNISLIINEIYSYIRESFGFEILWVLLVDKENNRIFSDSNFSKFDSKENFDKDFFRNFNMNLNDSLGTMYQTYKTKIPFYNSDIMNSKDGISNQYTNEKHKLKKMDAKILRKGSYKSVLQFPLTLQNEVIGILNLLTHKSSIKINKPDIEKILRLGDQIAGVIYNAHLLKEMKKAKRAAEIEKQIAQFANNESKEEKLKSERLLLNILPEKIARELKENGSTEPIQFGSVSVLFTDFEGFTKVAENLSPTELITELDSCFSYFDSLMERYNLEKLKTIGDSYMCAGGIPVANKTHPVDTVLAALEIRNLMEQVRTLKEGLGYPYWELRIGIHTGPLVAGVIGQKKFEFD
jgi:PAS domain S-box-containing protein